MSEQNYMKVNNPHRLLTPGSVVLISVGDGEDDNFFPVAWNMPLRKSPPMVAILSGKRHYSYQLMDKTGEFGLNIPDRSLAAKVIKSGKVSGHDIDDKFAHTGLTKIHAGHIKAPLVQEAVARMECRISQVNDMGGSALVIAQILHSEVRQDCFSDGKWDFSQGLELIHHMGGNQFAVSNTSIQIKEGN